MIRPVARWAAPGVVVAATLIAFLPVLSNGFIDWDDQANFVNNAAFRGFGWAQLTWMATTFHLGVYQPLAWLMASVEFAIGGSTPWVYHAGSWLVHAATAGLVYGIAVLLLTPRSPHPARVRVCAAAAALLFAVHPLRVEAVAWASAQGYPLAGAFFAGSVAAYLRAHGATPRRRRRVPSPVARGVRDAGRPRVPRQTDRGHAPGHPPAPRLVPASTSDPARWSDESSHLAGVDREAPLRDPGGARRGGGSARARATRPHRHRALPPGGPCGAGAVRIGLLSPQDDRAVRVVGLRPTAVRDRPVRTPVRGERRRRGRRGRRPLDRKTSRARARGRGARVRDPARPGSRPGSPGQSTDGRSLRILRRGAARAAGRRGAARGLDARRGEAPAGHRRGRSSRGGSRVAGGVDLAAGRDVAGCGHAVAARGRRSIRARFRRTRTSAFTT